MSKRTKQVLSGVVAAVAVVPLASSAQGMMGMPDQSGSMPMMGAQQVGTPTVSPAPGGMPMMQQRHARMQEHMQKMEAHMASIEELLRQLVELQKQE